MQSVKKAFLLCLMAAFVSFGAKTVDPSSVWAMPIGARAEIVNLEIYQERDGKRCFSPGCLDSSSPTNLNLEIKAHDPTLPLPSDADKALITVRIDGDLKCRGNTEGVNFSCNLDTLEQGHHELQVTANPQWSARVTKITTYFRVSNNCEEQACLIEPANLIDLMFDLCRQVSHDEVAYYRCTECLNQYGDGEGAGAIWTAFGCIPTDAGGMVEVIVRIGLLIGGGTATLIILAGSFMLSISQGDPKKTTEAKEMITAAVIGLIFIVFSISILQLIGVQILQIPEFGQ